MELPPKIEFPDYFNGNARFQSLQLGGDLLVDYTHQWDFVRNIKLRIKQKFLVFVVEGEIRFEEPTCSTFVSANEAVLVRTGSYLMSEDLSKKNQKFQAILFFLSDDLIQEFLVRHKVQVPFSNSPIRKHIWPIKVSRPLQNFFISVVDLSREPGSLKNNEPLLKLKANELLFYLSEQGDQTKLISILTNQLNDTALLMEEVMENNFLKNKKMEELAFLCRMSLSQFKRKFSEIFHTTPGNWIRNRKLDYAHSLLIAGKMSVAEITYSSNFESPSTFIKLFKKKFGKTPGQFRSCLAS